MKFDLFYINLNHVLMLCGMAYVPEDITKHKIKASFIRQNSPEQ